MPIAHEMADSSESPSPTSVRSWPVEDRLRLDHDRRETRRHALGHSEELAEKLSGEEREAHGHQRPPRHGRPREDDGGDSRDEEPRGGELRR